MRFLFGRRRDALTRLQAQIAALEAEVAELEHTVERARTEGASDAVQRVRGSVVEQDLLAKRRELEQLQARAQELAPRGRAQRPAAEAPPLPQAVTEATASAAEAPPEPQPVAEPPPEPEPVAEAPSPAAEAAAPPPLVPEAPAPPSTRPRRNVAAIAAVLALLLVATALAFYSLGPGYQLIAVAPRVTAPAPATNAPPTSTVLAVAPSPTFAPTTIPTPSPQPTALPTPDPVAQTAPEPEPEPEEMPEPEPELPPTPSPVIATGRVQAPGFSGVNFHVAPSTSARIIRTLPNGTLVGILEGAATADGFRWSQVRAPDGQEGWVVATTIGR